MIDTRPLSPLSRPLILALAVAGLVSGARCEDWPTYRHDNLRSGVTSECLQTPLRQSWVYRPAHRPQPAWTGPAKWDAFHAIEGLKSMRDFDPVFHVTVTGDDVTFGSSADDSVHCLDAASGAEKWTFCADGPVRLPPTHAQVGDSARLYFGSDDGRAYCIDARDGALVWKQGAADSDRLIPSNGKLISQYPVRTGVLIQGDRAYFAASLLPWEESWLCAVDAQTGKAEGPGLYRTVLTGATLQGAMLASAERLYALQGRSGPLVFGLSDGAGPLKVGGKTVGGVYAVLSPDSRLIFGHGSKTGWLSEVVENDTERVVTFQRADRIVLSGTDAYLLQGGALLSLDYARFSSLHREQNRFSSDQGALKKQQKQATGAGDTSKAQALSGEIDAISTEMSRIQKQLTTCQRWTSPCPYPHSLILAGDLLFAGGDGQVAAFRADTGEEVWRSTVDGQAHGLAIAGGRLYVSVDTGAIHCFTSRQGARDK